MSDCMPRTKPWWWRNSGTTTPACCGVPTRPSCCSPAPGGLPDEQAALDLAPASHANRAGADHLEPLVCHDRWRARRRLGGQPTGPDPRYFQLAESELCGWHIDGGRGTAVDRPSRLETGSASP